MPELTALQIEVFLLAFTRIVAIVALLPVFGSDVVPVQVKAGLSILVAVILFPFIQAPVEGMDTLKLPVLVLALVKELAVGIVIGFTATFLFAAVQFAGRLIDTQMGFAMVEVMDPFTETEVTSTGQFFTLLFSIMFFLVNGHYFMLLAIQKSFEAIPLLGLKLPAGTVVQLFLRMTGDIFVVSLRMAAPVFVVLVLTSLALGVVARTVPQINVFFVGMPLRIALGLVTTIMVLPALGGMFRTMVDGLIRDLWRLLYLMA